MIKFNLEKIGVNGTRRTAARCKMLDSIFPKSLAEVALELVKSYLEFAGEKERAKYQKAEDYFRLYEQAFRMILETSDKEKPKAGF